MSRSTVGESGDPGGISVDERVFGAIRNTAARWLLCRRPCLGLRPAAGGGSP